MILLTARWLNLGEPVPQPDPMHPVVSTVMYVEGRQLYLEVRNYEAAFEIELPK